MHDAPGHVARSRICWAGAPERWHPDGAWGANGKSGGRKGVGSGCTHTHSLSLSHTYTPAGAAVAAAAAALPAPELSAGRKPAPQAASQNSRRPHMQGWIGCSLCCGLHAASAARQHRW